MSSGSFVTLRNATVDDCRRVWEWRNEASTRSASFDDAPIPYEDHERWYLARIRRNTTRILIAIGPGGREIGYVRFDVTGDRAEISVSLAQNERRKGYGAAMIRVASDRFLSDHSVRQIRARIKSSNSQSVAAFRSAGYTDAGDVPADGVCELVYQAAAASGS